LHCIVENPVFLNIHATAIQLLPLFFSEADARERPGKDQGNKRLKYEYTSCC